VTPRAVIARGLRVLGYAIREQPAIFAVAVLGSVLFGGMTVGSAYVVGAVIGQVVVPAFAENRVTVGALALGATAIFGVSVIRVVGIFGRRLGAGAMQYRLQASYRRRITRRYLELPLAWHRRHQTGTLLSNANSDVEAAFVPIAPLPFAVGTLVMLVGAVGAMYATDWVLALIGTAVFPAVFGLNVMYSRRMSPRATRAQRLRAELSAMAHESFDGALVIKTMGREAEETARFTARADQLRDALISMGRVRGLFDPIMDALPNLGTLLVLVLGGWRLSNGAISVQEVVSVAFLFTVLAFPVRAIGWVLGDLPRSVVGWERVQAVLAARGDTTYGERSLSGTGPVELTFDNVSFHYPANEAVDIADTDEDGERLGPPVLQNVSFTVPPGRTVALVGPTGSGKSTVAALAARLMDPQAGAVRLDGVDVRELSADALAATVALVPQIPFIFDDTIAGNVALDRTTPEGTPLAEDNQRVWDALRLAQADGFVAELPQGVATEVGERGTSLSGGQRQRLTLARALAGRPRLLILDDATSAVDPRVEAAILRGLRESDLSATVLVVAYRRATIALADEVVYLENGRVVAHGTHSELLARVPGYADLVTAYEQQEAERAYEQTLNEQRVGDMDEQDEVTA